MTIQNFNEMRSEYHRLLSQVNVLMNKHSLDACEQAELEVLLDSIEAMEEFIEQQEAVAGVRLSMALLAGEANWDRLIPELLMYSGMLKI